MKISTLVFGLLLMLSIFSCTSERTENRPQSYTGDSSLALPKKAVYNDYRENMKLSVTDTIVRKDFYYFSNNEKADTFVLKIVPGMVKNTKAELKIITADQNVIYRETFDAFFFVRGIFEPDTLPKTGGQREYEVYMNNYWKALTAQQYEAYFEKEVYRFFTNMHPIDRSEDDDIDSENIADKDFAEEIINDPTIKLIEIICFDCDEGARVIGYSRTRNKIVTLLEFD